MVLERHPSLITVAAFVVACASSKRPNDEGDVGSDDMDSGLDAGSDAAPDAGLDAGLDAGEPDANPNSYPCEESRDCGRWWPEGARCVSGFCCSGEDVDGSCMCGDRQGGCPAELECCDVALDGSVEIGCAYYANCDLGSGF